MNDNAFQTFVLEWQKPIYNLAYRMLGNDADAADATQEIFSRLLLKPGRLSGVRDFKPWIFRVATNVTLNLIRARSVQQTKENEVAQGTYRAEEGDPLEQRELEVLVQSVLARLPGELRAPLVLHFFNGLSKAELAEVLSVPRTTVQFRIKKGLDTVRTGLKQTGHWAAVPSVEALFGSSAMLDVPPTLSVALCQSAIEAGATSGILSGVTAGGIFMVKKIVIGLVLVSVLSAGAGYCIGYRQTSYQDAAAQADALGGSARDFPGEMVSRDDYNQLKEKYDAVAAELRRVKDPSDSPAKSGADVAAAVPSVASAGTGSPSVVGEGGDGSGIDWSAFEDAFAGNFALLNQMMHGDDNGEQLAPEDQAKAMKFFQEYMKVVQAAQAVSDQPFFDAHIFPEFVESLYAAGMEFDEVQREELFASSQEILARHTAGMDLDRVTPLELLRARRAMIYDLNSQVENHLSVDDDRERWKQVHGSAKELMLGSLTTINVGVHPEGSQEDYENEVLGRWKEIYSLTDNQLEQIRGTARRFLDNAQNLLVKHGAFQASSNLSLAQQHALEQAMLTEQIAAEQSFYNLLGTEQVTALKGQIPIAIAVSYGSDTNRSRRRTVGF